MRALAVAALATLGLACQRGAAPGPRVLDALDDISAWRAIGSDGVTASVRSVPGQQGGALRLELDLGNTAGYAIARRDLALELPEDYELSFDLRGDVPVNHLEVKLIDNVAGGTASDERVWWYRRADYAFPRAWHHIVIPRRQISFAWGPTDDHTLRRTVAIELVVASGQGGGRGWIELDNLALRPRAATRETRPSATASTQPQLAARAIDGDPSTAWRSTGAGPQQLTIDLGRERDLAGLIVRWADSYATAYTVETSRDGTEWQAGANIRGGDGGVDPVLLPEATARYLRLSFEAAHGADYQLAEVIAVDRTANGPDGIATELLQALALQLPRGHLPRGITGEQPYWTLVGVDGGGGHDSLLSEDGAVELASGASLEPFIESRTSGARTVTSWATVDSISQALVDRYLPIPSVTWHTAPWELTVTALGAGAPAQSQLAVRYTVRNRGDAPLKLRLVLAVRPIQVNPPKQFLNIAGGVRRIGALGWRDGVLALDGAPALRASPDAVGAWPLHQLGYPATQVGAPADRALALDDATGLASAALAYDLELAAHEAKNIDLTAPLTGAMLPRDFDAALADASAAWHAKLDRVGFRVPADGAPIVDTLRSSLAYMLLSRDGAMLRPGTRSYARAWIRDGAMISEALLRLGHADVAADFLRAYAPHQFASGKVPCCVERGAVPVPEHDSHGQLIHLVAELARYTGDRALTEATWPNVVAAARYMDGLRASERTADNQRPGRRAQYGLLPPSISHEGYSAKPAYSYWDDFWGLTGYRDAAWLAGMRGDQDAVAQWTASGDAFERDLLASLAATTADHAIDYIPGAADLGDFDATSTTIALSPGSAALPPHLVAATFERAWQQLLARQRGTGNEYTPYELRLVGAFVRLSDLLAGDAPADTWRSRALAALAMYFADQRPRAWNQWAEVVGRDLREPRFLGDMPHAWVHSDYARAALDLFAYERARDHAMILAAGVPAAWLSDPATGGFAIRDLRTPYGPLSYEVVPRGDAMELRLGPGPVPPGGFVIAAPHGALTIHQRPATLVLSRSGDVKHL